MDSAGFGVDGTGMLGALLAAVDRSRLNGHDLVTVTKAQARQAAHLQAELLATMAEMAYCPEGGPQSVLNARTSRGSSLLTRSGRRWL